MPLKNQLYIILAMFAALALVIAVFIASAQEITMMPNFQQKDALSAKALSEHASAPKLKHTRGPITHTGTMVFIEADNVTHDSIVIVNNRRLDKQKYEIMPDAGVYLKPQEEGLFKARIINKYGSSSLYTYAVNNNVNIKYESLPGVYKDFRVIYAVINGKKIRLNSFGQGTAPPNKVVGNKIEIKGLSKKTGYLVALAVIGAEDNNQKFGVHISSKSTARYLVNERLLMLGEKTTTETSSSSEKEIIDRLASNLRLNAQPTITNDTQIPVIKELINKSVREIRAVRN